MEILEYGNPKNEKIILIHGFQSPYQIWDDYIDYYKNDYCVIVPILAGHNINEKEDFVSFDICAKELEEYYITKYGNKVFAIYGMSMGGILASYIWKNKNIEIEKLILESSPLLSWNKFMTNYFTKWYLNITHKTQNRDERTIKQAIGTIVSEDKVDVFFELFDHLSDKTIINCVQEVGKFNLPSDINTPNTEIYYFYGSKINEILFRKVAHYLKKNYQNTTTTTICLKGKGHCEDALINPEEHIKTLYKVLKK